MKTYKNVSFLKCACFNEVNHSHVKVRCFKEIHNHGSNTLKFCLNRPIANNTYLCTILRLSSLALVLLSWTCNILLKKYNKKTHQNNQSFKYVFYRWDYENVQNKYIISSRKYTKTYKDASSSKCTCFNELMHSHVKTMYPSEWKHNH